ncbi:serine/threonine protein phosphatase [Nostoc sp. 'Peltigera membranacea cyanobiont' 210A]|uniref:serine/threonine phosphatase n=1 Tax=Nostoc sp. 'Peltigera membranacea cyanobiont' 210A TaxID=2014529 RepID=UPI000B9550D1|nr:serine/threonine phosphatase [Nostoc sp. 'Peltigera membranacea cyanobiont' 210A]OYD97830.1 serine/threonine protein phosphatase [Nostoc sp. 'Peltigera membranacea cyanobiont' 210A]
MLICPQCKFENPNSNKFCQNCGTSLTHKVCPECSTDDVPVNALRCYNCDTECGTVFWAIIAKETTGEALRVEGDVGDVGGEGDEQAIPSSSPISQITLGSYLDSQERYQLLDTPLAQTETAIITDVGVRVLDCQPYQISPIEAILESQESDLLTPAVEANEIPRLAKLYIALQSQGERGIPSIHDAWQQGDIQVLIIENRSDWQYLLDLWQEETTSSLKILHWCYEMTRLWAVLEPVNCRQSLLDLSNLRLDEDQTLALQRLYVELSNSQPATESPEDAPRQTSTIPEEPLTIQTLGRVWQALFRQSQRTQFGSVVQMLGDLEVGKIQTIAQLRSRLEEISIELEALGTATLPPIEEKNTAVSTIPQSDELEDIISKTDDMPTVVLAMQLSSLEDAGRTDVGRQRHHNEDCFGIETKIQKLEFPKSRVLEGHGLYILCDGMGGHAGGEIASELAVNTLRQYFQEHWIANQLPTEDSIREAVYLANEAIYKLNQQDARSGVGRMGTTLVMLLIQDTQAAVAHVGDSRLYRLTRKQGLEQVTVDHEVGQREINRGVEASIAYARPDAYQLTQALGPRDENSINPDVGFFDINEDTLLLLASDGLSDNDLLETHWQTHLQPLLSSGANLERGVTDLIDLANQYNGHDNITGILIRAKVRPNLES